MQDSDLEEIRKSITELSIKVDAITRFVLNVCEFDFHQDGRQLKLRYESFLEGAKAKHPNIP